LLFKVDAPTLKAAAKDQTITATLYQQGDSGGWIPISVVNEMIGGTLNVVSNLRDSFQRDEDVDFKSRQSVVAELKGSGVSVDEADAETGDDSVFRCVLEAVRTDANLSLHALDSGDDHFVKIFRISN
jgi:hypothetical protein